jgi:hypothetical protein
MEVALSRRQTEGPTRNSSIDPLHEPRQPALGCASDPWRTPQARHRCGSDLGREIYAEAQETSIARMEDVLAQPRRWDCRDGSLRRTDPFVSVARWHGRRQILWLGMTAHPSAEWVARQLAEACGWDGTPEYLVRDLFTAKFSPGGFGPWAFGTGRLRPLTLAKWACGTADWLSPPGVPRPCRCICRAAPASTSARLYGLLQFCENPSISEQGCAGATGDSNRWAHLFEPNSRRITSSVRSDLIYDRDSRLGFWKI